MSELNNLIPISYDNPERPTVSGRELHDFLEVTTRYNDWFNRMTEYGFTEGEDYYSFLSNRSDGLAGKPRTDHQLTIQMAKELCMIQRNERGKQARQYFLAVEAQWNSPEAVMRRAVLIAQRQNDQLKAANRQLLAENNDLKPDAEYARAVCVGKNCRTTIINGKVLYKDREFVDLDEDKINAWTMEQSKKLWGKLNHRVY